MEATFGATALALAYGQANPTLAVIWAFGLAFGLVLQRSRFCFASAFRDLYLLGDGRVLKGIVEGRRRGHDHPGARGQKLA